MGESSNERNRKVRTRVVTRRTVRLAVVDGRKGKLTERNQVRDHMVNYAVFGVEWSQPGPRPSGQAVMPKELKRRNNIQEKAPFGISRRITA